MRGFSKPDVMAPASVFKRGGLAGLGGERWGGARAGHLFLAIRHLCLFLPPPHQTIRSTFSPCLRIWPIFCTQFMTMARVLVHGGRPWSGPDPKGGGGGDPPPPLRTPKLSHGTRCFVGAGGAGDFVLGIRQGEFFLFHPMCLSSKYSEFCGEFKNG